MTEPAITIVHPDHADNWAVTRHWANVVNEALSRGESQIDFPRHIRRSVVNRLIAHIAHAGWNVKGPEDSDQGLVIPVTPPEA